MFPLRTLAVFKCMEHAAQFCVAKRSRNQPDALGAFCGEISTLVSTLLRTGLLPRASTRNASRPWHTSRRRRFQRIITSARLNPFRRLPLKASRFDRYCRAFTRRDVDLRQSILLPTKAGRVRDNPFCSTGSRRDSAALLAPSCEAPREAYAPFFPCRTVRYILRLSLLLRAKADR